MEELIELVAASFARHGIECRDSKLAPALAGTAVLGCPTEHSSAKAIAAPVSTELLEHNFRKRLQGDPAP